MIAIPASTRRKTEKEAWVQLGPVNGHRGHIVQFYEHDDYLVSQLGDYLLPVFNASGRAIIITTPEHSAKVGAYLRDGGVDCDALQRMGRLIIRDARETLGSVCSEPGVVDPVRFKQVIGSLVSLSAADGKPLRAFGEMVALLLADGKAEAALELEGMWNELLAELPFALLCGYPMHAFASSGAARRFAEVCRAHTQVLPTEEYRFQAGLNDDQLRAIAVLQQQAAALKAEVAEHSRAQDSLRRREAQLTSFVETAPVGLHWVNAEGVILWANRAELEMLGYDWEDYVGHPVAQFHVDPAAIELLLTRLHAGETVQDSELEVRCRDGTIKRVLVSSSALWENGRFVHSQCFTRDVTEQRRAEQLVRHAAAIVEGSDDGILSKNLDGVITSWNPAAQRIFGYTAAEMIGQSIVRLIPQDRHYEEAMILDRLKRGERIDHYETIRRRKDGAHIDVSLTISPVREGNVTIGASKIVRDITAKRAAEKALVAAQEALARSNRELQQQVADLRRLQELSAKAIGAEGFQVMLDDVLVAALEMNQTRMGLLSLVAEGRDGLVVAASRGFDQPFLEAAEFVPRGEGAAGWCYDTRQRVVIENVATDPRYDGYRASAELVGVRAVHSTPLIGRNGQFIGVLSAHFTQVHRPSEREMQLMDLHARNAADLIENAQLRRQLERELELREAAADDLAKLNLELEQRVQERTASLTDLLGQMESFSYAISHDLRSPLRSMTGFAEALRDEHGSALSEEGRGYLARIIRAGERMNRLINDVLAYARVNRERLDLHPVALIDGIKQVIQHSSELQSPRTEIRIAPDMPWVMGNDAFLTQVFANLLGNAVKFVPPGTRPCINVEWRMCGENVRVDVVDNGIGIPPDYQARLFGLFERLHAGKNYEGTGMGLAIVRRAVERMGGNVGVESDGATGSRFWFMLRRAEPAERLQD